MLVDTLGLSIIEDQNPVRTLLESEIQHYDENIATVYARNSAILEEYEANLRFITIARSEKAKFVAALSVLR